IDLAHGNSENALNAMKLAADMEDSTEKHPVTPGEVLPARELLGDMLIQMKQYKSALDAYEAVLTKSPNRFNSLYNAGFAAEKIGDKQKAIFYYKQLLAIADIKNSDRQEIAFAQSFLKANQNIAL
ncbi:MAG TPA: tetratricopeptide repeat protein, partial [Puia sp.]|nr:tetratricopeptide repeat protein [Puia sp.]